MATPAKINYTIYQGSTFKEYYRWESSTKVYKPITNITKSAPVVITAIGHNIAVGWRCRITGVAGMKQINSSDDIPYYVVTDVTTDSVTLNAINSTQFQAYTGGGILEYNKPVDMTGYTARMQIRSKVDSPDIIEELTTENGGILIDNINHTIIINISANKTQNMTFTNAVYSVELVTGNDVIPFISGNLALVKEVTR